MSPPSYRPQTVSVRQHDLRLRWRNWPAYVSPNMELKYRLQYREILSDVIIILNSIESEYYHIMCPPDQNMSLVREFKADDLKMETQEADVTELRQNTHYVFRVVPLLVVTAGNPIEGKPTPQSSSVRTRCGVPVSPEIHDVTKSYDESSRSAVLTVFWRVSQ